MLYGNVGGAFKVFKDRAEYEAWISETRTRVARKRRNRRIISWAAGIAFAALVLGAVLIERAYGAPLPKVNAGETEMQPYTPGSGTTIEQAKEKCEQSGGHWFVQENVPEFPTGKIIGCLWLVPKDMK